MKFKFTDKTDGSICFIPLPEFDGTIQTLLETTNAISYTNSKLFEDPKEFETLNKMLNSDSKEDRMLAFDIINDKINLQNSSNSQ